ncbi:MAG: MBL fold metallo-hydrolase [Magnetococcus sp. WYHC-3]
MKIRFWGVRGSLAHPGPTTLNYGGNTTCLEVRTAAGTLIILDAGTGIQGLATELLRQMPLEAHLFFTHTHWDHIQGLPLFTPLHIRGNRIHIYGVHDAVRQRPLHQTLGVQFDYPYFPVREAELSASLDYHTVRDGDTITVGDARVYPVLMHHPGFNLGYRIEADGKSLFFTGDHEKHYNPFPPHHPEHAGFQALMEERQRQLDQAMAAVDLLVADTSYTEEEYRTRRGWGHSTYAFSLDMARRTGARLLAMTHHDPQRDDTQLQRIDSELQRSREEDPGQPPFFMAREGLEMEL